MKYYSIKLLPIAFLLLIILSIPSFFTDFSNGDEAVYSIVAGKINQGSVLYKDVVDTKPPIIYYIYALTFMIVNKVNIYYIKILFLIINICSCLLMYLIGKELYDERYGLINAFLFALFCYSGKLPDFLAANAEILMNLFVLISIYLFIKHNFKFGLWYIFFSGISIAIAFLIRFQGGIILPLYVIIIFLHGRMTFSKVKILFVGLLGFSIPILLFLFYFIQVNAINDLYFWLYKYNVHYIRLGNMQSVFWDNLYSNTRSIILFQLPIFILLSLKMINVLVKKQYKNIAISFILLYFIVSAYTFFVGGRFYGHYFIQALPPIIFLTSFEFLHIIAYRKKWFIIIICCLLIIFPLISLGVNLKKAYILTKKQIRYVNISDKISKLTSKEDKIFIWADGAEFIYYYSKLYPGTRFVFINYQTGKIFGTPHNWSGATPEMNKIVELKEAWLMLHEDLKNKRPDVIIDETFETSNFTHERYELLRKQFYNYSLRYKNDYYRIYIKNNNI